MAVSMIIVIESRLPLQYSVEYQKRTRKTNKKQGFRPVFQISDKSTLLLNFFIFGFFGAVFLPFLRFPYSKAEKRIQTKYFPRAGAAKEKGAAAGQSLSQVWHKKFFLRFGNAGALRNCAIEKKTVDGKRRILSDFCGNGAKIRGKIDFCITQYVVLA